VQTFCHAGKDRGKALEDSGRVAAVLKSSETPAAPAPPLPEQSKPQPSALPFTNLNEPQGVAVDAKGTVYVADNSNRILTFAPDPK
jgi:DNA-binding beta-propeller fold protein YncE